MTTLEETAHRQSVWSNTADVFKGRVESARWVTFVFSALGALLAAIASQLDDPPRRYLAVAGAVLLAVVGVVTPRFLGAPHIANWVRARAASEALKREAYKYATSVTPYHDPLKRDAALNSERERIEHDVDDLLALAISSPKAGSAPRDKLSRDEYVAGRVRGQIDRFYLPRANANKRIATSLRRIELSLALAAAIITAMAGLAGKDLFGIKFDFVALTAVLTTVASAVLAHIEATRCDFLVMTYRAAARRLSAEIADTGAVNALSAEKWSEFVNRCEAIISDENTSWLAKWTKA
jgi:SMODS and SLOG-associating 2TM effector domain 1/Protein of unknown function (DUF4231)